MTMQNTYRTTTRAILVGALLVAFTLPATLFAQSTEDCSVLDAAKNHYAYAELDKAQEKLVAIENSSLNEACMAEKYKLLGAIDVVRYIVGDVADFEGSDQDFTASLQVDPYAEISSDEYPPRLIRNRFELNRRRVNPLTRQEGEAVAGSQSEALEASRGDAVRQFVSHQFTPERYNTVVSDQDIAQAMLDVSLAKPVGSFHEEDQGEKVYVRSVNYVDQNRILAEANARGILFDAKQPAIRLDINETVNGQPSESHIALTKIKQQLMAAGFRVVDETVPNFQAQILIRGHVDASSQRVGSMGYGGSATTNLTMRWADGSDFEFGASLIKEDGQASSGRREASLNALESVADPVADAITKECIAKWNDRQINGAIYLLEVSGNDFAYNDFKKMLVQISTYALNDPLENPTFNADAATRIYIQYRPQDGDFAQIMRDAGFVGLSKEYAPEISGVSFNHVSIKLNVQ